MMLNVIPSLQRNPIPPCRRSAELTPWRNYGTELRPEEKAAVLPERKGTPEHAIPKTRFWSAKSSRGGGVAGGKSWILEGGGIWIDF
jgi:hypothetical protein